MGARAHVDRRRSSINTQSLVQDHHIFIWGVGTQKKTAFDNREKERGRARRRDTCVYYFVCFQKIRLSYAAKAIATYSGVYFVALAFMAFYVGFNALLLARFIFFPLAVCLFLSCAP